MRHSDPRLTMNVYAKTRPGRLNELAERVEEVVLSEEDPTTGTKQELIEMETGNNPGSCLV